ncbi:MAG: LysR family transcriptional regulator, partial [Solirubrobacteraceae bacterium]|nr:LysR family transcriptional regulator [Solirubrobacteraceae bacterium]
IGEAARRLGVSQPALSKRLRQLENLCGARLLDRSPSGVVATPAGARLATAALRVVDEVALLDDLLSDLRGQSAPVRIASSPVISESLLPELLAAARAELTGVPIELTAANSAVVRRLVATGAADLGIAASANDDDPGSPTLAHDEVVVALPPGHPWVDRATLTVADLAGTSLVMRDPRAHARGVFDRALAERGLQAAAPFVELGSTTAAVAAALETGTPAVLSRLALGRDDRLTIRRLDDLRMDRRFAVLTNPDAVSRPGVVRVREALLATVESHT